MSEVAPSVERWLDDRPNALGRPDCSGIIRATPEDFVVDEVLGYEPDGEGSHMLLRVEKSGVNTGYVAGRLAAFAGLAPSTVGYAGTKDRHALVTQWFSVPGEGATALDWESFDGEGMRVLEAAPHRRKLKRGALAGNAFAIAVRGLDGEIGRLEARLAAVMREGVPNYFGPQRYGRRGANLERAKALFAGRRLRRSDRSFALSAARSFLFDEVLGHRVTAATWNTLLPGELAGLDGSRSFFAVDAVDETLAERSARQDVHPTGPLWGRGEPASDGSVLETERLVAAAHPALADGLAHAGLRQERRALRLPVREMEWRVEGEILRLRFFLPPGTYATSLLRECVRVREE